jgi:hypothetical protein
MKLDAIALVGNAPWPDLSVSKINAGLNVFHGPPASGKTAIADLVTHALCGRRFQATASEASPSPVGELIVESGGHHFRLHRQLDAATTPRLTVAAADPNGPAVDGDTVRGLLYGLSPALLGPIYALNFRESTRPESLLSVGFANEFRAAFGGPTTTAAPDGDDIAPLYARIHELEQELTVLVAALGYRRRPRTMRRRPAPSRHTRHANSASHFLRRITEGELVELRLRRRKRGVTVVNRAGELLALEAISPAQRDQVYLSLSLALVAAAARHGVHIPLVLDEPFVRMDRRRAAALAAVLDTFGRGGHQVLVFTARQEVVERFAELGATRHDLATSSRVVDRTQFGLVAEAKTQAAGRHDENQHRTTTRVVKRKRRRAG